MFVLHFQGTYTSNGADPSIIFRCGNAPKVFFYGFYKYRLSFWRKKEVQGCIIFVVDIKRPWEFD